MMSSDGAHSERKAFKDWFDCEASARLSDQFFQAWKGFETQKFLRLAQRDLETLEFQARVRQFSNALAETLPDDIPQALEILTASLPPAQVDCDAVTNGWLQWPLGQFIADHGIDHLDESMQAMVELTQRFSAEFAVRPFVERYPEEVFKRLRSLTEHQNPHVRRWCSEGTRPRLPWGRKLHSLIEDPTPILPILESLKNDEELYVRRSVANNLNDLSKDHPDLVTEISRSWMNESPDTRAWVVRHGLRSLIKAGHSGALDLMGFSPPESVSAHLKISPESIVIGDFLLLSATLHNGLSKPQNCIIDYVVHFVRKGGKTNGKVFKWKTIEIPAKSECLLEKKHPLRPTTIRALYPGIHRIELQINGVRMAEASFELR